MIERKLFSITTDGELLLNRDPDVLKLEPTNRGFLQGEFEDGYGKICSLQESSNCIPHIWLGIDEAEIFKDLRSGPGTPVKLGPEYDVFSRMHLTQDNVKMLLPLLTHFAEHGGLPHQQSTE